jgi:hypothetical protein
VGMALLKNVKGEKMGRRVPMLLAAIAVMVALFAAAAYAAQIEGTDRDEILNESNLSDKIEGKDGVDTLNANLYGPTAGNPSIPSQGDRDRLSGGRQADTLDATDGDTRDVIDGGKSGGDVCSGDIRVAGDDQDKFVHCETINGQPVGLIQQD